MQIRRQLRARRLAEKQAQMRAALAEKQARDVQESTEKERKVELREEYKQRMNAWRQVRPCIFWLLVSLWRGGKWNDPYISGRGSCGHCSPNWDSMRTHDFL